MLINCWNFTPEKAFDGRRFINYMIRIFEVMSMDFCDSMCLWNLTLSALILINEWRKTNKKDHYFDHPADIAVASLANTHLWKKRKKNFLKYSLLFVVKCSRYSSFQQFVAGTKTILGQIRAKLHTTISTNEAK